MGTAFALWITGLPASGKSTVTRSLKALLDARGVDVAVLESDVLRKVLTVHPRYDDQEREIFYRQMVWVGSLLMDHDIPVIFDATANRRSYREQAKRQFIRFMEVYVDCPVEVCIARDPKGIYRQAAEGSAGSVPGLETAYEPPEDAEVVVRGDTDVPEAAAQRILAKLEEHGFLAPFDAAQRQITPSVVS
jgi:adenylylsulfate kinase